MEENEHHHPPHEHEHTHEHAEHVHPEPEAPHEHHEKKKEQQLSVPMAIIFGAFIIAIAIIVVKMPHNIVTQPSDPNALDATTVQAMVAHVIATKNQDPVTPVSASDHITGTLSPKVTLIEYSDLECPFCKNFDGIMQKVMQNYGDSVAWVYRHYPLDCVDNTSPDCTVLHSKARHEAVASECAYAQAGNDGFWKYITDIFNITPSNNGLDPTKLTSVAQDMGLNMTQFASCLSTDKYADVVSTDAKEGLKSNVTGTPTSILVDRLGNTYTIAGAYPYEVVSGVIDQILKNQ